MQFAILCWFGIRSQANTAFLISFYMLYKYKKQSIVHSSSAASALVSFLGVKRSKTFWILNEHYEDTKRKQNQKN